MRAKSLCPSVRSALAIGLLCLFSVPTWADGGSPTCNLETLKGTYGLHATGIRTARDGSGQQETHATISVRTYDGKGGFTGLGVASNGEISGVRQGLPTSGTYEVYANCTGRVTIYIPGVPTALSASFVIVNHGQEVKEVPTTPGQLGVAILQKQ